MLMGPLSDSEVIDRSTLATTRYGFELRHPVSAGEEFSLRCTS